VDEGSDRPEETAKRSQGLLPPEMRNISPSIPVETGVPLPFVVGFQRPVRVVQVSHHVGWLPEVWDRIPTGIGVPK
jgi:hypothetical protein